MSQLVKTPFSSKLLRRVICLWHLVFKFNKYRPALRELIAFVIDDIFKAKSRVPKTLLSSLIDVNTSVNLSVDKARDGNTTYLEQITLASLVKAQNPKNVLEIGTFDGHSTLTFALNTSKEAKITTVDLPSSIEDFSGILDKDLPYILDKQKLSKLYQRDSVSYKIRQLYADSTKSNFKDFQNDGAVFEFVFIDAGHSYDCVKNDTEKALNILSKNGVILWHDYTPNCAGVFTYLNELASTLNLLHIENTNLVIYRKDSLSN